MKKLKAVFGDWNHNFYSCDATSYENYISANKKLPSLPKKSLDSQLTIHSVPYSSLDLAGSQTEINEKFHRSKSNHHNSNDFGLDNIELSLKEALSHSLHSPVKDLVELWAAFELPSYHQEVKYKHFIP